MNATWLNGALLGMAVAATLGPVNVAVIRTGLRAGFWPAWRIGIGAATVDFVYCMLTYLGLAPVLTRLPGFKPALWFIGGAFLIYLGLVLRSDTALASDAATGGDVGRPYLTGVTITLVIIWFGGLAALLHGGRRFVGPRLFRIIAVICGTTLMGFGGWFMLHAAAWTLGGVGS